MNPWEPRTMAQAKAAVWSEPDWVGGIDHCLAAMERWLPGPRRGNDPPLRIADFGAGVGRLAIAAVERYDVYVDAIEPSLSMRRFMNDRVASKAAHVAKRVDVLHRARFLRDCDFAWCVAVVQHLSDPELVCLLADAVRTLRSGARFVVQYVNDNERHAGPLSHPRPSIEPYASLVGFTVEAENDDARFPTWTWAVLRA